MKKIVLFILTIIVLAGCTQNEEQPKGQLTIMPVEFHSGATLQKKIVQLLTTDEEVVDEQLTDKNGEVHFQMLVEGKNYFIRVIGLQPAAIVPYHESKPFEYRSSKQTIILQTYAGSEYSTLAVPTVFQNPELPHGCEITSLTAIFNYYGCNVSKLEMADHYLPKGNIKNDSGRLIGPDPAKMYVNNPRDKANGKYVFVDPIISAANDVIKEQELSLKPVNLSGSSLEQLEEVVRAGIPVLAWITIDLKEPTTRGGWYIEETNIFHEQYVNLHAAVIIGQTDNTFKLMDPLRGVVEHPKKVIYNSYVSLGEQAMTLIVK